MGRVLARRLVVTAGRRLNTGSILSGAGHAALILWVILGDWLFTSQEMPMVAVTDVSFVTEDQLAAMSAAASDQPVVEPAPEPVAALPDPEPEPIPAPEPEPEPAPEPAPTPPQPAPLPEPVTQPIRDPEPAPEPDPAPVPEPDPEPVVEPVTEAPVNDTPQPELVIPSVAPQVDNVRPKPKPAEVITPDPVDVVEELPEVAPEVIPEVVETVTEEPPVEEPPEEAAAPVDGGEVLATEANQTDTPSTLAPTSSARPRQRPEKPVETVEPEPPQVAETQEPAVEQPVEDTPEPDAQAEALAAALAEAQAAEEPVAASGPPMTGSEIESFRVSVSTCWNVGALSSAALETQVIVGLTVGQNGIPDAGSIRMVGSSGGTDAGAEQAYEAARRAIIRCGKDGFPLPPEKYDQWKELELVFDPSGMRMR